MERAPTFSHLNQRGRVAGVKAGSLQCALTPLDHSPGALAITRRVSGGAPNWAHCPSWMCQWCDTRGSYKGSCAAPLAWLQWRGETTRLTKARMRPRGYRC